MRWKISIRGTVATEPYLTPRRALASGGGLRAVNTLQILQWLSLEAVLVALVWQDTLAIAFQASISLPARIVLALAVWLTYAGDRWLDGWKLAPHAAGAAPRRHGFSRDHRLLLGSVWGIALAGAIAGVVTAIPSDLRSRGFVVLAVTALYMVLRHTGRLPRNGAARWIKPVAIGVVFAWGTALAPLLANMNPTGFEHTALGCWITICLLNCVMIALWESPEFNADSTAGATAMILSAAAAGIAVITVLVGWQMPNASLRGPCFSAALSAVCLFLLQINRTRIDPASRRLLADAVLLTPILFRPWIG